MAHYPSAADYLRARGVEPAAEFYARLETLRKEAWTLAKISDVEQIEQVKQSLIQALQEGKSFREWQQALTPEMLALPKHYQETVFRTAVLSSYNGAKWTHFRAHAERRPVLRYIAINDSRTRPAHRALHGLMMPVGDARWANLAPPLGFNCRCSLVSLSDKQAKALGYTGTPQELPTWEDDHGVQHTATADKGWSSPERRDLTDYLRQKEAKAGLGRAVYDGGKPVPKPEPYLPRPPRKGDPADQVRYDIITHGQADGVEYAALLGEGGALLAMMKGEARNVDLGDLLKAHPEAKEIYHNHPSGVSLSKEDLYTASLHKVGITAFATWSEGEYSARVLTTFAVFDDAYHIAEDAAKMLLRGAFRRGEITKQDALDIVQHIICLKLHKQGVIAYNAQLTPELAAIMKKLDGIEL